jgi:hypothetical protein
MSTPAAASAAELKAQAILRAEGKAGHGNERPAIGAAAAMEVERHVISPVWNAQDIS